MMNLILIHANGSREVIEINKNMVFDPKEGDGYYLDNFSGSNYVLNLVEGGKSIELTLGTDPRITLTFNGMADLIKANNLNEDSVKTILSIIDDAEGIYDLQQTVLSDNFKGDDVYESLRELLNQNLASADKPNGVLIDDFGVLTEALSASAAGQVISNASTTPNSNGEAPGILLDERGDRPEVSRTERATFNNNDGQSSFTTNAAATVNINDALTLNVTPVSTAFVEDSTTAGQTVATSSATDPDGQNITYTINDTTNYTINATTGEVTLTQTGADIVNAGNDLPNFTVTASSTIGETSTSNVEVNPANTITVNDALSTFEMNTVENFTEDSTTAGDTVTTVKTAPSDEDGGAITYSISSGNEDGYYAIDENTGKVTLTVDGAAYVNAGNDLPKFSVTATSAAGAEEASSATVENLDPSVIADTTAPDIDKLAITNIIDTNSDYSLVTMIGTGAEVGNTITIFDEDDNVVGTTIVDVDGNWQLDISNPTNTPINDNEFFKAMEKDSAGNETAKTDTTHYWHGNWSNGNTESSDDFIMAGSGNDTINTDDTLTGTNENGTVTSDNDDTNDKLVIDGGDGNDTVTFGKDISEYTITTDANENVIVTESSASDSDGDDKGDVTELRNVETVKFTDGTFNVADKEFTPFDLEAKTENDTAVVTEDGVVIINVLENDENGSIINSVQTPTNTNGEPLGTTSIVTVNGVQQIQFTPANNFDVLNEGQSSEVIFTYTTKDGNGNISEDTTVTVTVTGQNNDLTYVSESAGYSNVVGYYKLDVDGNIVGDPIAVIDNQNGMTPGLQLADLEPDNYEFFIIANGANEVDDETVFTFDENGEILIDGNTPSHPVYYTEVDKNIDGEDHFIFTSDGNGGTIISIEDLPNLGDADFNDVVLHTNFEMDNHVVVTSDINDSSDTGSSNTDNITSDATPTITGNTEKGATVVITDENGVEVGRGIADKLGDYSITTSKLEDGSQNLTITSIGGMGASAVTTQAITIDTIKPDIGKLAITDIVDNNSDYSSVTMHGTGAEVGDTITLFNEDGEVVATNIIVRSNGTWQTDISNLSGTPITDNEFFTVSETDRAGNETAKTDTTHYWHGNSVEVNTESTDDFVMTGAGNDTIHTDATLSGTNETGYVLNDVNNDTNDKVVIDGGDGDDTVTFGKDISAYTITNVNGKVTLTESSASDDNGDNKGDVTELRNVETIKFADGSYDVANKLFISDEKLSVPLVEISIDPVTIIGDPIANIDLSSYIEHNYGDLSQNQNIDVANGKDYVVVNNTTGGTNIKGGNGSDIIHIKGNIGGNTAIDGGNGRDILILGKTASSYTLNNYTDNHGVISAQIIDNDTNQTLTVNNIEEIRYTETPTYEYSINLDSFLSDSNSELINITFENIPTGAVVKDSNGNEIFQNDDNTYTIETEEEDLSITLTSNSAIDNEDLNSIVASITSVESSTNITETTITTLDDTIDLGKILENSNHENVNIDLTNNQSQNLSIDLDDILDITDNDNELKIFGDSDDKVTLEGGDENWSNEGQAIIDGDTFNVYQGIDSNVKVLIDDDVSIDSDI